MNRRSLFVIVLMLVIIFIFFKFNLNNVFFNYPKDAKIDYGKITNLKEERALGFSFLLPSNFVSAALSKKKENLATYKNEKGTIIFILEKNQHKSFLIRLSNKHINNYEYYNEILTNKWNPLDFQIKYCIVYGWRDLEIKRIKINDFNGFIFSGTRKIWDKPCKDYIYELFTEDYGLTIAVSVKKNENFGEKEINYLISTIRKIQ